MQTCFTELAYLITLLHCTQYWVNLQEKLQQLRNYKFLPYIGKVEDIADSCISIAEEADIQNRVNMINIVHSMGTLKGVTAVDGRIPISQTSR